MSITAKEATTPVDDAQPTPTATAGEGRFPTIVIDPPWRYDNVATRGAAEDHYQTMSLDDLAALDIPAADNAHIYLWVTNGFIREGFTLLDAWGFTYKTTLTWCKPQIGMGNWFRNATEHVLFGVRGKLPTQRNDVPTWFTADRTRHSAKPERFYDLVESCSPSPWFEMFSRRKRLGDWHVWGNESMTGGVARLRVAAWGLADAETAVTRCRRCGTPADAWSLRDRAPCRRCSSPLLPRAGGAAAEGTTVAADGARPVEPAPSGSRPGTEVDNERETQ